MAEQALQQVSNVNSLSIIDSLDLGAIQGTLSKINQFQMVIQNTLKPDHDYGIIPGTSKPTLLKPGAEKILMLLGLTSEYEIIEEVKDYQKGFFAYEVKCILYKNGVKITEGFGHCNTKEKKYVNQDAFTLANTVLKMAKKRAQVDATLTVGSLSDVFTQDIEDMAEYIQREQLETMTPTDAANTKVKFGKYKGKMLREIYKEDKQYVAWLADNAREPVLKQAAKTVIEGLKKYKKAQQQQRQEEVKEGVKEEVPTDLFDGETIEISDDDLPFD